MHVTQFIKNYVLWVVIFSLPGLAYGANTADNSIREEINAHIEKVASDPKARLAAINEGRQHAVICAFCHGPDGNSVKPEVPNLSDQDPVYLLKQINKFIDGSRVDYTRVMQRLSRNLSEKEKIALVIYYASVPLKNGSRKIKSDREGGALYQARCQQCHGSDGRYKNGYARIAGQQPKYVERVLKDFRSQKKNRVSSVMSSMTKDLSDDEIKSLSAYIKSM